MNFKIKNRISMSPEFRKNIAEWLCFWLTDKGNIYQFFEESEEMTHKFSTETNLDAESGAFVSMMWNITLTDDGEVTQLQKALRCLVCEIENELGEASKKFLNTSYEDYKSQYEVASDI